MDPRDRRESIFFAKMPYAIGHRPDNHGRSRYKMVQEKSPVALDSPRRMMCRQEVDSKPGQPLLKVGDCIQEALSQYGSSKAPPRLEMAEEVE